MKSSLNQAIAGPWAAPRLFISLIALMLVSSVAGCGGGGGGGNGGTSSALNLTRRAVTAQVVRPAGFTLAPDTLSVRTGVSTVKVAADGTANAEIFEPGYQLAQVFTADNRLALMGWLRDGAMAVSPRTTAEALLYFDMGAYLLPAEARVKVVDELATRPEVAPLADAITAALAANPAALQSGDASIKAALQSARTQILASGRASRAVLIQPSNGKDGITVLQEAYNQVTIRNAYRRRAVAYIERVSYRPEGSQTSVASAAPIAGPIDISPVTGVTSILGTLGDIASGNVAYGPVTSDPVDLTVTPDNAASTKYRVLVLGVGGKAGNVTELTPDQRSKLITVAAQTVLVDFAIPLVANTLLPIKGDAIDSYALMNHASDIVQDFVNLLGTQIPGIWDKSANGDVRGALTDIFDAIRTSNIIRVAFFDVIYKSLYNSITGDQKLAFLTQGENLLTALEVVDAVLTAVDSSVQVAQIATSGRAESWDVTVTKDRVTLTPATASVANQDSVTIKAQTPVQGDLVYHWKTTGKYGHLTDTKGHSGKEFDSTDAEVKYVGEAPPATGSDSDTVTGTVLLIPSTGGSQQRVTIGSGVASIGRHKSTVTVAQGRVEMKVDAAGDFHVYLIAPIVDADKYVGVVTGMNDREKFFGFQDPYTVTLRTGAELDKSIINGEYWIYVLTSHPRSPEDLAEQLRYQHGIWDGATITWTITKF